MALIASVTGFEILDSRGNPTVEAEVRFNNGIIGRAAAPSGASTGSEEAIELRDGDKSRYDGKGVLKAVANINGLINKELRGERFWGTKSIDMTLKVLDGTDNYSNLGANATTAVSMAVLNAEANHKGMPVYQLLSGNTLPIPFMNVINAGMHAGNPHLSVQEFMIAPIHFGTFSEALRAGSEIYHLLAKKVESKYSLSAANVGFEGGVTPQIKKTETALALLTETIKEAGYEGKVMLALDCAAQSFYDEKTGLYHIDGKNLEQGELLNLYVRLSSKYPIISIEDPFHEKDFQGYAQLRLAVCNKVQIVADDLTVSQLRLVDTAIRKNSMHSLLLKVNQVGTITEAQSAVKHCQENGYGVMVSHRSGETEDVTISHLAVGWNTGMIKTGAPARTDRVAKYNELLRIERQLGANAVYAGKKYDNFIIRGNISPGLNKYLIRHP